MGFVLMRKMLLVVVLLVPMSAYAEDERCSTLRQMHAQGAASNGQFTRVQVAAAFTWYRANCGKKRVTTNGGRRD